MPQLLVTLVGEGTSDEALLPIIEWTLKNPALGLLPDVELLLRFVGPDDTPGMYDVIERALATVAELPCDLLFIHHDADGPTHVRWSEIMRAAVLDARRRGNDVPPTVPVVPVREMEAWLLLDEAAIREAAGAPDGTMPLSLPRAAEIEAAPDPKAILRRALRTASGLSQRRWPQIDAIRPDTIVGIMSSFEHLRALPAFQAFEVDVRRVIAELGWPERL